MTNFLEALKVTDNKTRGANGAVSYKSTLNANLDLHTKSGTMRHNSDDVVIDLFKRALHEDRLLALKNLFYIRDIEQGMGEYRFFTVVYRWLAKHDNDAFNKLLSLIPVFGSFKDLRQIIGDDTLTHEEALPATRFFWEALDTDAQALHNDATTNISLASKWAPSVGSKNAVQKLALRRILNVAGLKEKPYRQMIAKLRQQLNLVETKLTEHRVDEINYSQVPSQAFRKYSHAFMRRDETRFDAFLNRVEAGSEKVNAKTLHAHQLVENYIAFWGPTETLDKSVEAQWKHLPSLENTKPNVLSMVDVSGSMLGRPMAVAVALGIYMSEQTTGVFKDHFITFSGAPELVSLSHLDTLHDKVTQTMTSDWGGNTNLEAAYDLILDTAVNNQLPQSELPEVLFILSDMNFDAATGSWDRASYEHIGLGDTFFDTMRQKFQDKGYTLPFVVHWNISDYETGNTPTVKSDKNTASVSGFSQALFNNILNLDLEKLADYTPEAVMLEVLNGERYLAVEEKLQPSV